MFKKKQNATIFPANTYIKSDGTKVTEQIFDYGKSVMEICKDGVVISRFYDKNDKLRQDYIRELNLELVHQYDEYALMTYEMTNLYDENNKLAKKIEKVYEYYDNGKKSKEETLESPSQIRTSITYNEKGEFVEKTVQIGSVKTWYDKDDNPVKKEIDRGSGGIIIEDLNNEKD